MFYSTHYSSPIGLIMLGSDGKSLAGLWIEGQKYFGDTVTEKMEEKDDLSVFSSVKKWLDRYFAGKNPGIVDLPLAPNGGEFRRNVWNILCDIPYGEVTTYGDIAKSMAKK
ncbi:methylated-DNA--[protein]-cysteine S-methyltransferase [Brucepastera parasyntrophica]|uniref:methylated-DNA--[protein]-cysteine S-methyltransferase n=1 Tax=Brucepastera parasyntrophica TaxID=2880008 RepID=UPI00210B8E27|nr:methylated-DNA--[protein]-cysteine S-methyltransferase [Brucepastera parasyntrophica]